MAERDDVPETLPPGKRESILQAAGYKCGFCPAQSVTAGGTARIEVHHRNPEPDPDECERNAEENLTPACNDCHEWHHLKPTGDAVPIEFSEADQRVLSPPDYLILQILHESGPCEMSTIQEKMEILLSPSAVRERVYRLTGFDYEVAAREQPLADQDAVTGEWGLFDQITNSERGRIPDDPRSVLQRAYDERVRRALARGCDRKTVMDTFGIARRTTWYKQYRAQAYDFPLAKFEQGKSSGVANGELTLGEPDEVWGTAIDTETESDDVMEGHP